jgi:hypothetical protein
MKHSRLIPWGVAFDLEGVKLVTRGAVDFKAAPTLASGDAKLEKDGGTAANLSTLPSVVPTGGTSVRVSISASEAEASHLVITLIDQTSPKEWEDEVIYLHTPQAEGVICGKITSGTNLSATTFRSSQLTQATTDQLVGGYVVFRSGAAAGAPRKITAFDPTNDEVTCEALPTAPSNGDVYEIVNGL